MAHFGEREYEVTINGDEVIVQIAFEYKGRETAYHSVELIDAQDVDTGADVLDYIRNTYTIDGRMSLEQYYIDRITSYLND